METKQQQQQSSNNSNNKKLRSKILKILPKAVIFQNPPFSPGRSHRPDSNNAATSAATSSSRLKPLGNRGFSGPMIPDEARRKPKGEAQEEPTSPKVSCIGQIKHRKKQITKQNAKSMSLPITATNKTEEEEEKKKKNKKQVSNAKKLQRMFFYTGKPKTGTRKNSAATSTSDSANSGVGFGDSEKNAPPIGYMRRFASSREAFSNFDWKAQVTPEEIGHRDCYSEDDRAEESDVDAEDEEEEDEDDDDEIMIPFSAPIMGGGAAGGKGSACNFQPRKEINLWKRRTMAPPRPLQLKPVLTSK